MPYDLDISAVTVTRPRDTVIEYVLVRGSPSEPAHEFTMHANRAVTFWGPHTGLGNSRQVEGGAATLWRGNDADMLAAFKQAFPRAEITIR